MYTHTHTHTHVPEQCRVLQQGSAPMTVLTFVLWDVGIANCFCEKPCLCSPTQDSCAMRTEADKVGNAVWDMPDSAAHAQASRQDAQSNPEVATVVPAWEASVCSVPWHSSRAAHYWHWRFVSIWGQIAAPTIGLSHTHSICIWYQILLTCDGHEHEALQRGWANGWQS